MTTPAELAGRVEGILRAGGVVFYEREAAWILEAAAGIGRAEAVVAIDTLPSETVAAAVQLADRRAAGEPLQYVTGVAGFRYIELSVGPGVFIPRPETEAVAQQAMDRLPHGGTIVDVGTGSGAIALAVAHERPDARVLATESSVEALAWAAKNRDSLGLQVELVHCNLLDGLAADLRGALDVVVANPPYVPEEERHLLPRDVAEHEPPMALFAPGDALSIIRALADEAPTWLRPGGWLVLEIGEGQRAVVADILRSAGFDDVDVRPDLVGRPRVTEGRRP